MTKHKPKILLFDLDDTLLDSRKEISERNIQAINECRKQGIMIGVATARSEVTCARFTALMQPDLLISNCGALVRLHGNIIYECGFTAEETSSIIAAGLAENRGITVDCTDVTYSNRFIPSFNEPGMEYTDYAGFRSCSFKVCIEGSDTDFAERTAALIENCSWLAFSSHDWFKFSRLGVSKGNALQYVVNSTGIPAEEMIAFGDENIDIEMLEFCGMGVAMANADESIKSHADIVIGDNNSDAIADFLYGNIL